MSIQKPKVSIIVPLYNYAQYLPVAIESILKQTLKNWELIVINDQSTDNSEEIAKRYLIKNKGIKYFKNKTNIGPTKTLNKGIKISKGEYVSFLSPDDYFSPHFLKTLSKALDTNPEAGLVYCKGINVDPNDKFLSYQEQPDKISYQLGDDYYRLILADFIYYHSYLVRRDVLLKAGYFNTRLWNTWDWDLILRIAKNNKIQFINKPLVYFREGHANLTSKLKKEDRIRPEYEYLHQKYLSDPKISLIFRLKALFLHSEIIKLFGSHRFLKKMVSPFYFWLVNI